ncbi:hypothetical protein NMG60_11030683 [Bertholletia excelsa]
MKTNQIKLNKKIEVIWNGISDIQGRIRGNTSSQARRRRKLSQAATANVLEKQALGFFIIDTIIKIFRLKIKENSYRKGTMRRYTNCSIHIREEDEGATTEGCS